MPPIGVDSAWRKRDEVDLTHGPIRSARPALDLLASGRYGARPRPAEREAAGARWAIARQATAARPFGAAWTRRPEPTLRDRARRRWPACAGDRWLCCGVAVWSGRRGRDWRRLTNGIGLAHAATGVVNDPDPDRA